MLETWRWFGPDDVVPLHTIRQAGASSVVTSLHQIPYGKLWTVEAIERRKAIIAADPSLGLHWSVVESLPIHENIKLAEGDLSGLFDNYRQSMRNLAACGIKTICYNFMPVVDWTRTELYHPLPGGGRALRFNAHEFAAFDCLMLKRRGAEADYPAEVLARARVWFDRASETDQETLLASIMAGLPGAFDRYDIPSLRLMLDRYKDVSRDALRENLARFLREVIPVAEECGMRMAIHPDDPPRNIMGLPRIVSDADDLAFITSAIPSKVKRHHILYRLTGRGSAERCACTRAQICRAHPFRAFAQCRQGAGRVVHGSRSSERRHRYGKCGRDRARGAKTAA